MFFNLAVVVRVVGGHWETLDRSSEEAAAVLDHPDARSAGVTDGALDFARGMASYYAGDSLATVESLSRWSKTGTVSSPAWHQRAARVLTALAKSVELTDPKLAKHASKLAGDFSP